MGNSPPETQCEHRGTVTRIERMRSLTIIFSPDSKSQPAKDSSQLCFVGRETSVESRTDLGMPSGPLLSLLITGGCGPGTITTTVIPLSTAGIGLMGECPMDAVSQQRCITMKDCLSRRCSYTN